MRQKRFKLLLAMFLCLLMAWPQTLVKAAETLYNNATGRQDGYDYELWKDNGTTSMTLNSGGTFSCQWSNINNALFRKGIKFDSTKTYQQLGNISVDYGCDYQPNGNSYLCVYGWTKSPLVEYYIVDSWGTWRPPGAQSKGTITVDGGTYDVYETTRTNQSSIEGNTTFQQYWSVRTSKRTSGKISVSDHFKAWESKGMRMGKMYEAALTVEGYQSSGSANVYKNTITVGGSGQVDPTQTPTQIPQPTPVTGNRSAYTKIEAENYDATNASDNLQVIGTSNGGSGIGYINSGNTVTYKNVDFGTGAASVSMNVATEQNTSIQMRLGSASGTLIGTVQVNSTGGWNDYQNKTATVQNASGVKDLVLVFQGPVNVDSFVFTRGQGQSNPTPTEVPTQTPPSNVIDAASTIQAENYNSTNASGNIKVFDNGNGGKGVGYIENGNTLTYNNIDFGNGVSSFKAYVATESNTSIQIRKGSANGTLLGTLNVNSTGSWNTYQEKTASISNVTGVQTIVLVFSGAVNVDWFTFSKTQSGGSNPTSVPTQTPSPDYRGKKLVALTFDDGPNTTTTTQVLDKLERYGVVASFFLIGQNINDSVKPVMQRQVRMGCEIANHSYSHNRMGNMDANSARNEVTRTNSLIQQMAGVTPKFFRPPYIDTSNAMYQGIDLPFICGIMCNDWEDSTSAQARAQSVISNVKDGDIILMHDFYGNGKTVEALDTIIPWLKNNGYELVTVSKLFELKGVNPDQEYKIWTNVKN